MQLKSEPEIHSFGVVIGFGFDSIKVLIFGDLPDLLPPLQIISERTHDMNP